MEVPGRLYVLQEQLFCFVLLNLIEFYIFLLYENI